MLPYGGRFAFRGSTFRRNRPTRSQPKVLEVRPTKWLTTFFRRRHLVQLATTSTILFGNAKKLASETLASLKIT
jgi:hypothetical protein